MPINCANSPLSGVWAPQNHLKHLYYGAGCVQEHLVSNLPSSSSRVLIITGTSIYTKTPLINNLEALLGHSHAATFSGIQQHGQEDGVDQAAKLAADIQEIDTILSIGGGSPIDSAKTVCYRIHEKAGRKLVHMAIPTTLSAAECTAGGGFTRPDGTKVGFMHPAMGVSVIFYDASFARYTPERLWLSTGMRAVDHAVETMYHPNASEMPWKALAIWALTILAENLPLVKDTHGSEAADDFTTKLQLAAFASSGLRGSNFSGGMGLSHSLGHALGSPYGIPRKSRSIFLLPCITHPPPNWKLAQESAQAHKAEFVQGRESKTSSFLRGVGKSASIAQVQYSGRCNPRTRLIEQRQC